MNEIISAETINICLELLAGVSVPVTLPDAQEKLARLVAAREELIAALTPTSAGGIDSTGSRS